MSHRPQIWPWSRICGVSHVQLQRPRLSFGLGWQQHDVWQKTENSWHCARAGSSRMISDVPICLSLISHVALAASRPFKRNKGTQKDTSCFIHMQSSWCLIFSPSSPGPSEWKSLEEQSLFREALAPESSSHLGCNQHNGKRRGPELAVETPGCLGSDYHYLCPGSPPELHSGLLQRENTFAVTHQKKIRDTICQGSD